MKTSEIKLFGPSMSKISRFKLDNNSTNFQQNNIFVPQDLPKVKILSKKLNQRKTNSCYEIFDKEIMEMNCILVDKLHSFLSQSYPSDLNQIKFRVVKSAKKANRAGSSKDDSSQLFQMKNIKLQPINQKYQQNSQPQPCSQLRQKNPGLQSLQASTLASGTKLKLRKIKQNLSPQLIIDNSQSKLQNRQDAIAKLKQNIQKLTVQNLKSNTLTINLNQRLAALNQQNVKLRGLLRNVQMKQLNQEIKIDLKFSLKCIQPQVVNKQQQNKQLNSDNTQQDSIKISQKYIQQTSKHLQMIIVAQNIQIQNLQTKLNSNTNSKLLKAQKWRSY